MTAIKEHETRGPAAETKGERTRAKLVAATARLLQKQGYHATGLSEIVEESGAPRGSLYFHFPGGKEELACAALEASGAEWRKRIEAYIDGAPDLGQAIAVVCKKLADDLVASDFELGCPVATVALEASSTSEKVRATVKAHYEGWTKAIAARLQGAGVPKPMARHLATFALSAMEGALLLARVGRDPKPLLTVGETLRAMVAMGPGASPKS